MNGGVLEIVVQEVSRLEVSKEEVEDVHALSGAQEKGFGDIQGYYKEKDCVLLQGVTSSGKTEIYIHLIQETLRQGKTGVVLVAGNCVNGTDRETPATGLRRSSRRLSFGNGR